MMKQLIIGVMVAMLFIGCAKKPEQEISATQAALTAAIEEGANKYAQDEARAINDSLNAAMEEIKTQEGKIFKNYDKAKEMLATVKADSDALKAKIPALKEKARSDAQAAADAAMAAIAEAKNLLASAPRGKGSKADIEALKADLSGLEASHAEIVGMIAGEDYFAAASKADVVKNKALEITAEINAALEKAGKKRK
ncbi:MAG: hypothetical protein HY809_06930 [Nitrospirae bacterium]|nr:hypothetical protein [Nitrospirota bacterium]